MNNDAFILNERAASLGFDKQSKIFDEYYSKNAIVSYKRQRVRDHVLSLLEPQSHILELNAGTGDDAIFFAFRGHFIHATDISSGMLQVMEQKIKTLKITSQITFEKCSFTSLENLQKRGPYDLIFSNFAGINCTREIERILNHIPDLLIPGGKLTLVFLPSFCLWEFLMLFKGKFKTAFRRFHGRKGAKAQVEGINFRCWYYHPKRIIKKLNGSFDLIGYEGLCTLVPPSYIENFGDKYPEFFNYLKVKENKLKSKSPWKWMGDYVILSFRKRL